MAKDKVEQPVEPVVEPVVEQPVEESQAKKDFRALIETYKLRNPAKYALKQAELERKLGAIE